MIGLVVKKNADLFSVECEGQILQLKPKGTLKKNGIFVGDKVEFSKTIDKVIERKNLLIRPPLANLDKIFIVLAPLPKPDLLLIDKMILACFVKGIEPVLVINKTDITDQEFIKNMQKCYKKVVKIVYTCAEKDDVKELKQNIKGICAFAGQSAVGKSSLINALFGENKELVGELSKKIERGKQTTRMVTLYKFEKGCIADTAGFSSLDLNMLVELSPQEVGRYYPDFLPYLSECKYRSCLHKLKGDCGIIERVKKGDIAEIRYQNYLKIIDSLADAKRK